MAIAKTTSAPPDRTRRIGLALDIVLALTGVVAVAVLILDYGKLERLAAFEGIESFRGLIRLVQKIVVGLFVLDRLLRLGLARRKLAYFRSNWIDFALMLIAGAALAVASHMATDIVSVGALYVIITQVYVLTALILRGVGVNIRLAGSGIPPARLLVGSFVVLCICGSGLLMLPAAVDEDSYFGWDYIDALFTATSATCVTGLVVQDTGTHFTVFGQGVILVLIQLGGLGIMLFGTVLAVLAGKELSLRSSDTLGHMLAVETMGGLKRVAGFVVAAAFAFELVGAVMLYPMFAASWDGNGLPLSAGRAVWHSVFHSVSAFCNAGFALYGNNMMHGVPEGWSQPLRAHWQLYGVLAPLIVLGGLGFPVLHDCGAYLRTLGKRLWRFGMPRTIATASAMPPRYGLSLHSRIVLTTSAVLLVLGAVVLLAFESVPRTPARTVGRTGIFPSDTSGTHLSALSRGGRVKEAVFQSITARTAGFNTIDVKALSPASKLCLCGLMTIGGSPAGTAGGMKTVTLAVLVLTAYCMVRRRPGVEAFRRSIAADVVRKAATIAVLYLMLLLTVALLLCVATGWTDRFMDLLFEASSACGTVGLSTGVSGGLGRGAELAKIVIIGGMFVGRIGPLTLLLALTRKLRDVTYSYPSENVIIG